MTASVVLVVCDDATGEPALIARDENGEPITVTSGGRVVELDAQRPHAVGYVVCRECHHWHFGVVDVRADMNRLRCNKCGERSCCLQPSKPADVVPIRRTPATAPLKLPYPNSPT